MYTAQAAEEVLRRFKSSSLGLSSKDASRRLSREGFNELPEKKHSLLLLFAEQFRDIFVYILFGALILSLALPMMTGEGIEAENFLDAGVIFVILILNAVLGFVQEFKAEEAIASLRSLTAPRSRVRRDGKEVIVPSRELVPGDIVIVEAGDRISADGRIITLSHLEVNESSLTGESQAVTKVTAKLRGTPSLAERRNMVFAGTLTSRGSGEIVLTATGTGTEIGKIAEMVSETEPPETPLEMRMRRLSLLIGEVVISLCAFVVIVGFLRGFSVFEMLLTGVSLAVSAVPEGLPAVVTVCFAFGVRRMAGRSVLVRRLESLETLGSVTVICSDKTGTITENRMKVQEWWTPAKGDEETLALIAASCNRARLPGIGDPTEIGLLEWAAGRKIERLAIDEEEVPFSSEDKYMRTRHGDRSFVKGAPEKVLAMCAGAGTEAALKASKKLAMKGYRVLGLAEGSGKKLRFVGLIALEDPPRAAVKAAIAQAKQAGIQTIMITGDHRDTAVAIARQVGISGDALTGDDLDTLSPAELQKALKKTRVFARVSPQHKVAILEALKRLGHVVAMTGDGVNDAPALKGAHVGVAMGKQGTDVAREAASMVLADDNYATIVAAIGEGRRIYDNIRKFILYLLRSNFDELLLILTTALLAMPLPYLPLHILWINLMTDSLPALALSMEPAEPDVMNRPPRPPKEHILSGESGRLVLAALWAYGMAFLYFLWQLSSGIPLDEARTTTFTLAIVFELFLVFTVRSRRPLWEIGFFTNKWLLGAVAVPFFLQLVLLYTPLRFVFHLVPLDWFQWLEILIIASTGFIVFEVVKLGSVTKTGLARRQTT
jgi:Ca2+-transporting ATPase